MCESNEGTRGRRHLGKEDERYRSVNKRGLRGPEDIEICYYESINQNNGDYMTKQEELALIAEAQAGSEKAKTQVIDKYMRLCHKLARKFAFTATSSTHEDLVQEGVIGLLSALQSYDPIHGAAFITWAYYHVRGAIASAGRSDRRQPKFPRSIEDCPRAYNVEDPKQEVVVKDDLPHAMVERLIEECAGGFHTKRASVVMDRFGLLGRPQLRNCEAAEKYGLTKYAINSHTSSFKRRVREKFPELAQYI
jgi:RNA polymerase sigma factor (sigma-70 family)